MKKLSLIFSLLLLFVGFSYGQRSVKGTVVDKNGEPLIGASVLVQGTSQGTITDFDGAFKLDVPADTKALEVSYTGFANKVIDIMGLSEVTITLLEGEVLDEIVVTGLGIKKEKKALGYAVTTIGAADINLKPEADVARVLRGKVAGVDISQTSGLAGSGTNVIIRGYSSLTGTNQPLFVVDGVPFNSDTNADRSFDRGGATASSRFLDLDPNNIAEVSVLKGLSATVLYGEAGRNGVILITTKSGDAGNINKKMEVTVDQSLFVTQAATIPDVQNSYGNGFHNFASGAFSNWGASFTNRIPADGVAADGTINHPYNRGNLANVLPEYQGARYAYQPYDNFSGFFRNGLTNVTSLNVAKRLSEGTAVNFNYAYRDEDGFIAASNYAKHNFSLGVNTALGNGFKVNSTFNYITSNRVSPPTSPSFSSNPQGNGADGASLFSNLFYVPRSVDLLGLEYENPADNSSIFYRAGNDITNPLWTLENATDSEVLNRFFATTSISKEIFEGLNIMYRLGLDRYNTESQFAVNKGGGQIPLGALGDRSRRNQILNHDIILNFSKDLSTDLSLDAITGFNVRSDKRNTTGVFSTQQLVFGNLQHDNFINSSAFTFLEKENLMGAYLSATLGFRSYLYLNLQGRNDWTSTLEKENRSVFYPSASISFVPTDAIAALQNNSYVNYMKVRFGYGTSAG